MLLEFIEDDNLNPALKTLNEYLMFLNKNQINHPEKAYNYSISEINDNLIFYKNIPNTKFSYSVLDDFIIIKINDKNIGYINDKILYILSRYKNEYIKEISKSYLNDNIKQILYVKEIKIDNHADKKTNEIIFNYITKNLIFLNQIKIKDKAFYFYKNEYNNILLFDENKLKIGGAQDEWGAILIYVAKEYRNYGLGSILLKKYTEFFPSKDSGGVTPKGQHAIIKNWLNYVSEFLINNKYIEYVKQNKISKQKVIEILNDYKKYKKDIKNRFPSYTNKKSEIVYAINEYKNVIIAYDKNILNYINQYNEYDNYDDIQQLTEFIKGYMYFMSNNNITYLWKCETKNIQIETIMFNIAVDQIPNLKYHSNSDELSYNIKNIKLVNNKYKQIKKINTRDITNFEKKIRKNISLNPIIEIAEYKYQ